MADSKETVIFEVDVSSYEKSLAELTKSIGDLKIQQKDLQQQTKAGVEGAAQAYEKVTAQLKIQQQQYRTNQNVLVGYTAAQQKGVDTTNFMNNSIQGNRDLLKQLTAEYIKTKNPSEQFTAKIKQLSDALKQQEAAIGDTRRNVGAYADAFKSALGQLTGFGGQIVSVGQNLGGAVNAFKAAEGGVKGFGAALATTGLPLIIAGINALSEAFNSFKPIADEVERVTNAVGAAFTALTQGRSMEEAASQAYELTAALQDLEDSQNALVISNSLWDSKIKQLMVSLKNKGITEKEGRQILEDLKKTEQERFQQNSENAKEDLRIARATFLNKTGLYSAELDALLERGKVKRQLDEDEIKSLMLTGNLTREQVLNLVEQERLRQKALAESAEKRAKISDEELKKIADLEAKVNSIKGESAVLREQISNREEAFNQKIQEQNNKLQEERARKAEETAKRIEEANKKELESDRNRIKIAQEQDKARKEAEQKRIADRSKQYTEQVNLLNLIAENDIKQTELIVKNRKEAEQKINDIKIRSLEKQLDLAIQFLGEDGDITQEELEGIRSIQLAIQKLRQEATTPPVNGKTFGEIIGVSKEQQDEIAGGLKNVSQIVGSIQGLVNEGFKARNNEIENNKNVEIAAIEATSLSREEKDIAIREREKKAAQETYELQKKQFEFNKAISIVQTIINTAQAVIAQLSNPTPYVGIVLAALAAATGAAQIAVIAAQKPPPPPKFATGVIGLDGAGTETSDSIDAKLSRGESVITAKATRRFHRELAYMEAAVGNTPNYNFSSGKFATGVIGTGGFATRDINNNAEQAAIMRASIIEGFANAPQPVVAVKEINKVNKGLTRSVAVSEL